MHACMQRCLICPHLFRVDCAEAGSRAECSKGLEDRLALLPWEVLEDISVRSPKEAREVCTTLWKARDASTCVMRIVGKNGEIRAIEGHMELLVKLPKLEHLSLTRCSAECLHAAIARCTALHTLDMSHVKDLAPHILFQLPRLTTLRIAHCHIRNNLLSMVIGEMTSLRSLALCNINLGGVNSINTDALR